MPHQTSPDEQPAAPAWFQNITIAAVSVVAVVAAVASYVHMRDLAQIAGQGWRSVLLPLSVDGLLVAASMVMLKRRLSRRPAGLLPWTGFVLGLLASLAANVASAPPTVLGWLVNGWPPVALAVSFELLILVVREGAPAPADEDPRPGETWDQRRDRLVAAGTGRRKLAELLDITEHEARQILTPPRQVLAQNSNGREPVA